MLRSLLGYVLLIWAVLVGLICLGIVIILGTAVMHLFGHFPSQDDQALTLISDRPNNS